jgi:hypothetical protein
LTRLLSYLPPKRLMLLSFGLEPGCLPV